MAIGIDFSLSSPSVCIAATDDIRNSRVFCYQQSKKMSPLNDFIYMMAYPTYSSKEERFFKIADNIMNFIKDFGSSETEVFIEGYAFGANGKIFDIAEATSVLKQRLFAENYKINVVEPSVLKKFATGKGSANKFSMLEYFKMKHPGFEIETSFDGIRQITDKMIPAPITDIVDAYWLSQYGIHKKRDFKKWLMK